MKTKKLLTLLLILGFSSSLMACENPSTSSPSAADSNFPSESISTGTSQEDSSDVIVDNGEYVYQGTPTVAPYTAYNEDGSEFATYDNMFEAIRNAGANSSSSNKMYVHDANELMIFKRQSNSNYWCYDGLNFVGSKTSGEALEWGKTREKCFIVNGRGTGYTMVGTKYYENSDMTQEIPLELTSGSYNYMFTKAGVMSGGQWVQPGYGYMECYVRLSEATYVATKDSGTWNAYIFINGAGGKSCDLGLIGVVREEGVLTWALVRNCQHPDHNEEGNSFAVLGWDPVTTMTLDPETGVYKDGDDLFFQCWQTVDGWILKITNLANNKVFTINEYHQSMFKNSTQYFRFLLAASYCPVELNVWNARSGASLRNVVFDNINIARYEEDNEYDGTTFEEFYPGTDNMLYGFSQGAYGASMVYETHKTDGKYGSGNAYTAGQKFLSFSCYYDGGGHYQEDAE